MNNLRRFLSLILVLAAVPRCETDNSNPLESSEIPGGTIHGFVINGGSRISGAEIALTGQGIERMATSGEDGGFTFADLPVGIYTLTVVSAGFSCESATAEMGPGETVTTSIACTQQLGTVTGKVTADGDPVPGVQVRLTSDVPVPGVLTDAQGTFTLAVPPGAYSVTATPPGTTCGSVSVMVNAEQTVSADIVCQPTGKLAGQVRWPDGTWWILGESVVVSGPISLTGTTTDAGRFSFDGLPPGDYTVTASSIAGCESATATVQTAQATSVVIVCGLFGGRELAGSWFMNLPEADDYGNILYSQVGLHCPPPLPLDSVIRSIVFDSTSDTISIEGLVPEVTIAGSLQVDCEDCGGGILTRSFSGRGGALQADGSSIRTQVTGRFGFSVPDNFLFFGSLTRAHRDQGENLICTETYAVSGVKR